MNHARAGVWGFVLEITGHSEQMPRVGNNACTMMEMNGMKIAVE